MKTDATDYVTDPTRSHPVHANVSSLPALALRGDQHQDDRNHAPQPQSRPGSRVTVIPTAATCAASRLT